MRATLRNRFQRLKRKDTPFQTFDPVVAGDMDILQRHLRELFPQLDLNRLQKVNTAKCKDYQTWMEIHCRQRHYSFQIRKCLDPSCCLPPTLTQEDLQWLPDPILTEDKQHYQAYQDIKGRETTDADRPSLIAKPPKPTE